MHRNAANSRNVADDWVARLWIATFGNRDEKIGRVADFYFARVFCLRHKTRPCAVFVRLGSWDRLRLGLVFGKRDKNGVILRKPRADFLLCLAGFHELELVFRGVRLRIRDNLDDCGVLECRRKRDYAPTIFSPIAL